MLSLSNLSSFYGQFKFPAQNKKRKSLDDKAHVNVQRIKAPTLEELRAQKARRRESAGIGGYNFSRDGRQVYLITPLQISGGPGVCDGDLLLGADEAGRHPKGGCQ